MNSSRREWGRMAVATMLIVAGWLVAGCATYEQSGLPGSAASMARNQMMLVRAQPPSFGYYRLSSLSQHHPDLALFVAKRGTPDFLAETGSSGRNYYILYYLGRRQAFACRTRSGQPQMLEFAGPYPITDREFRVLDDFRGHRIR